MRDSKRDTDVQNSLLDSVGDGEGNGTPLQYSCLENPMDGGAWQAAVHGVVKSQIQLSNFTFIFTFMHWRRKWQPTPVFLPGESQGQESLVGCSPWGHTELDTTEATQQQQLQREGEGGMIWENGIETCIISYMKRIASPGWMHDTGCSGLVHWDDPEGQYREESGRGFRMGNMCTPMVDSC